MAGNYVYERLPAAENPGYVPPAYPGAYAESPEPSQSMGVVVGQPVNPPQTAVSLTAPIQGEVQQRRSLREWARTPFTACCFGTCSLNTGVSILAVLDMLLGALLSVAAFGLWYAARNWDTISDMMRDMITDQCQSASSMSPSEQCVEEQMEDMEQLHQILEVGRAFVPVVAAWAAMHLVFGATGLHATAASHVKSARAYFKWRAFKALMIILTSAPCGILGLAWHGGWTLYFAKVAWCFHKQLKAESRMAQLPSLNPAQPLSEPSTQRI